MNSRGNRNRGTSRRAGSASPFTFMTERGVPPTDTGSERGTRPSIVFRKAANGFRSDWGSGLSAFQEFQATINGTPRLRPGRIVADKR